MLQRVLILGIAKKWQNPDFFNEMFDEICIVSSTKKNGIFGNKILWSLKKACLLLTTGRSAEPT